MMVPLTPVVAFLIAIASFIAYAEPPEDRVFSLDAHVHGISELAIAMEANLLEIELSSPAMNLTGFEHKAVTPKDVAAAENVASILGQPDNLFSISGGRCTLVKTFVDISDVAEDNNEKNKIRPGNQPRQHLHGNTHQPNSHSEINATFHYNCDDISGLSSIAVALFDKFPGIHQIHTIWINEKRQGAMTLNTKTNVMNFK